MYINFNYVYVMKGFTGYVAVIKRLTDDFYNPISVQRSSEFATKEEALVYGKKWADEMNTICMGYAE